MLEFVRRTLSDSGRFKRRSFHSSTSGSGSSETMAGKLQREILELIEAKRNIFISLLRAMEIGGERAMKIMACDDFGQIHVLRPDIYRIGPVVGNNTNGVGVAILPTAPAVLGKEHDRPVVLIPKMISDDTFILTISLKQGSSKIDVAIGWRSDESRKDWTDRLHHLLDIKDKVSEVVKIISNIEAKGNTQAA